MINRVIIAGRLTRDPEGRATTTGKSVADFSVAVDRRYKSETQTADFFKVIAWGTTADFVTKYCQKGRMVLVEGRLQTRKYTDKNGNDREITEIVADSVNPLDRPRDGDSASSSSAASGSNSSAVGASTTGNDEIGIDDYDPFADE